MSKISPCLWFAEKPEAAAAFYVSVFPNSKLEHVHKAAIEWPGGKVGDTLLVEFTLAGQAFQILAGGPSEANFNTSISLSVSCADQAEVDQTWDALSANGGEAIMGGWLKDQYGVHWQIVPQDFMQMMRAGTPEQLQRLMNEMHQQIKLDVARLRTAFNGT